MISSLLIPRNHPTTPFHTGAFTSAFIGAFTSAFTGAFTSAFKDRLPLVFVDPLPSSSDLERNFIHYCFVIFSEKEKLL